MLRRDAILVQKQKLKSLQLPDPAVILIFIGGLDISLVTQSRRSQHDRPIDDKMDRSRLHCNDRFTRIAMATCRRSCAQSTQVYARRTPEQPAAEQSQQMLRMVDSNWVFNRLKGAPGYEDEIRNFLGHSRRLPNSATVTWEPIYSHIFILQIPVVTLKTSTVLFFVGLWVSVWDAAMRKHLKIDTPEFKVSHTSSSMDIPRFLMTNVHF